MSSNKGQSKTTTGFAKAVNEAVNQVTRVLDSTKDKVSESTIMRRKLSTKRQRRESKYLSPPYVSSSGLKKGSSSCCTKAKKSRKKKEDAAEEEQACAGEHDDMNMTLSALKAAGSSDKNHDAISEWNVIRKKLQISSFILDKYHNEFKGDEKARLMDDMKKFGERVEAVHERIHALAENTSIKS